MASHLSIRGRSDMSEEPNIAKLSNEILADRWKKQHDEEALGVLIKRNRPFVIKTAKKMKLFPCEGKLKSSVLDYDDILSIGDYAICKAAQRYEIEKGNKFLTYAGWWIFCELNKSQRDAYGCVALPQKVYTSMVSFTVEICRIEERDSSVTDHDAFEMAVKNLGITEKEGYELYNYAKAYLSWTSLDDDHFSNDDNSSSILDYQQDSSYEERAEREKQAQLIDLLIEHTPTLSKRDIYVLKAKYALDDKLGEASFQEIGKKCKCTRDRARQICDYAITELSKTAQAMGITPDMMG